VLAVLPSMKSPTMSPLANGGYAVESVVEKRRINLVIPELIEAGATDLVEMAIAKIVP
jgi:ATP phosphoribosyltransferase